MRRARPAPLAREGCGGARPHPLSAPRAGTNRGYVYREQLARGGGTVLAHLVRAHPHSDEATWRGRLERGEVTLDGGAASPGTPLRAGAWLCWTRPPWTEPEVPLAYAVLHHDADLLVVAKPSGLPTVPAGGFLDHTLLALVRRTWPEATPAHRLGRGTSGLVAFALSARARAHLATLWSGGGVRKEYRALVAGRLREESIEVMTPIGSVAHPRLGRVAAAAEDGRRARSTITVRERRLEETLVDVLIETGRPHQIRIHAAAAGHPLVGDPLYGPGGWPRSEALPGDLGYHLHAWRLAFRHPDGRDLRLECAPPPTLRSALEVLTVRRVGG